MNFSCYLSICGTNTENWGNKYWYQMGNDGCIVHYKIGCDLTYQIRVDDNSYNKNALEEYASWIRSCNSNMARGDAACIGSGISAGAVLGLVIANIAFPPTVLIDVIVGIFGTAAIGAIGTAVYSYLAAHDDYQEIQDSYIIAKACGIRVY